MAVDLKIKHRTAHVGGMRIFYREAGSREAPAVLLLHGFPSSSRQFRDLLGALALDFHLVAPDLPGFGHSDSPDHRHYAYRFEHYADTIEEFVNVCGLERYALCLHDYGAQVGFRVARRAPERVAALIIQNSEAHLDDGRSASWTTAESYWRDASPQKREALRCALFTKDGIRNEFLEHLPRELAELVDPDTVSLAWWNVARPGVIDALLDLHLDYRSNVEGYPAVQEYLRHHQPPALVLWGRRDQYYGEAAARAYQRELPGAEIHVLDGGHWLLETHGPEVISLVGEFLRRHVAGEGRWCD